MDTFHLLQISDLHMAVRPRVVGFPDWGYLWAHPQGTPRLLAPCSYDPDLTEAIARYVSRYPGRFDALVVTGDLGTTGSPADLKVADGFLRVLALGGGYAGPPGGAVPPPAPVWVMPGNHDRFSGPLHMPGGTHFDRTFAGSWTAGRGAQAFPTLQGTNGERLAIVAADFTLAAHGDSRGVFGWLGQGKVYPNVLAALGRVTGQVRDRFRDRGGAGVLWAVHFAPVFPGLSADLALLDEDFLPLLAEHLEVHHILCGHTHVAREYAVPNHPAVMIHCAGTAAQYVAEAGNVMHATEVDVDGGVVTAVRRTDVVWDQQAGDFH